MRKMNKERIFLIITIGLLVMMPIAHADFIDWMTSIFRGTPVEPAESEGGQSGGGGVLPSPAGGGVLPLPAAGGEGGLPVGGGEPSSGWDLRLYDVFRLNAGETQIFKNADGSRIKVTLNEIIGGNETVPAGGGGGVPEKRVGAADMTYRRYDKNGNIVDEQRLILLPRDIGFVVEVLKTGGNKALLVIPIPEPR